MSDHVFLADSDAKLCQVEVFGNGGLTLRVHIFRDTRK